MGGGRGGKSQANTPKPPQGVDLPPPSGSLHFQEELIPPSGLITPPRRVSSPKEGSLPPQGVNCPLRGDLCPLKTANCPPTGSVTPQRLHSPQKELSSAPLPPPPPPNLCSAVEADAQPRLLAEHIPRRVGGGGPIKVWVPGVGVRGGGGVSLLVELHGVMLPVVLQVALQGRALPAQVGGHLAVHIGEEVLRVGFGFALRLLERLHHLRGGWGE